MDPEAVVAQARGDVHEALLTRTGGGLLDRPIMSEQPLVALLRDDETLHYLMAGPAPPTRISDGEAEQLAVRGSYQTLTAISDVRILLAVGSADGDRTVEFHHGDLVDARLEKGLLSDTVVIDAGPAAAWEVPVASGSDPRDAVGYARERLSSADAARSPEAELVESVFRALVGEDDPPLQVEQYGHEDLDALLEDLEAHRERLEAHLAAGESAAARGAAATVDALGAEGERLAEGSEDPVTTRRVRASRHEARRAVVADSFGVADRSDLGDALETALERRLLRIDPDEFARIVADLWAAMGYRTTVTGSRTTVTGSSGDDSVDVVCRRSTPVEQTVIVRGNCSGPDGTVGPEAVRRLASRHRHDPEADHVVVVTTGAFTDPAVDAASDVGVKLVDGQGLADLVAERDCYDVVARTVIG